MSSGAGPSMKTKTHHFHSEKYPNMRKCATFLTALLAQLIYMSQRFST